MKPSRSPLKLLAFLHLSSLWAFAAWGDPHCYRGEVLDAGVNLRLEPSLKKTDGRTAQKGERYIVQAVPGDDLWVQIVEGPQKGRFIYSSKLRLSFRTELPSCQRISGPAEVSGDRVNLRAEPSLKAQKSGMVYMADPLTVSPVSGSAMDGVWLKIIWPDEHAGKFIREDTVKLRLPALTPASPER